MMGAAPAVCVVVLCGLLVPALGDKHSLYYIYTALSKDVALPGIYEFTALGLLDDLAIDYYNSKEQVKVPKQDWMREKLQPDYWDKGTQSRKSKEQWFKVNVDIVMQRMGHNQTDLHVLQWRHGCEIEEADGKHEFLKGVSDYGYDGSDFLSFDNDNVRWIAPVPEALPTKRKWDDVAILNQYTKGYLERECVDWLTKFLEYRKESLKKLSAPPDVHVFEKKSETDMKKLTLTCLATGFYPKDVVMSLRKSKSSLPEHLLTSSGVRPNDDGTYQLRKSVEIQEDEAADYDCYVTHSTFEEPITKKWDTDMLKFTVHPPKEAGKPLIKVPQAEIQPREELPDCDPPQPKIEEMGIEHQLLQEVSAIRQVQEELLKIERERLELEKEKQKLKEEV
ncbi:H-2 class I histocompatibility antigen, Q10 alpha chain-like isoform X3 [Pygocentrus nattereri]|uniref:Ig-like domain-containing protein n=1 Tax=Pygocentrus nattereri TaxID=42514 RepID=A0A3B4EKA2_PYGNA|nr:H-2 class I histocompatibility antigen, Q10 alpha chain-like isoform X3 [Pygocentrus nattereri]